MRGADALRIMIQQDHQQLSIRGERAGFESPVIGARLRGTEITFVAFDADGDARQYRGRVAGARMSGESDVQGFRREGWSAARD
jgi:hypothetical protein